MSQNPQSIRRLVGRFGRSTAGSFSGLLVRKSVAGLLVLLFLRASVAGAVSIPPGTLAVIEPSIKAPESRAAWGQVEKLLYLDPLLLVKGKERVTELLDRWEQSGAAITSSHLTAYRTAMDRSESIMAGAWDAYYSFQYDKALGLLDRMDELMAIPGDTALRAEMAFNRHILEGVVLRAMGRKGYRESFARAATLDPGRELPAERYSPQTVELYRKVREELDKGAKGILKVSGSPGDASVVVNGKSSGGLNESIGLLPGKHYLQLGAPGYEPWYEVVEVDRYAPVNVRQDLLPAGPTPGHSTFFLGRLKVGDRGYLSLLAQRLEVDYILLPQADGQTLQLWLLDKEGSTVDHDVLWKPGDDMEAGLGPVQAMLEPLRQHRADPLDQDNVILPEPGPVPAPGATGKGALSGWRKYALVLGAVLVMGAASASSGGGGTKVEVTW